MEHISTRRYGHVQRDACTIEACPAVEDTSTLACRVCTYASYCTFLLQVRGRLGLACWTGSDPAARDRRIDHVLGTLHRTARGVEIEGGPARLTAVQSHEARRRPRERCNDRPDTWAPRSSCRRHTVVL
jgi:hypothetical protein